MCCGGKLAHVRCARCGAATGTCDDDGGSCSTVYMLKVCFTQASMHNTAACNQLKR